MIIPPRKKQTIIIFHLVAYSKFYVVIIMPRLKSTVEKNPSKWFPIFLIIQNDFDLILSITPTTKLS